MTVETKSTQETDHKTQQPVKRVCKTCFFPSRTSSQKIKKECKEEKNREGELWVSSLKKNTKERPLHKFLRSSLFGSPLWEGSGVNHGGRDEEELRFVVLTLKYKSKHIINTL